MVKWLVGIMKQIHICIPKGDHIDVKTLLPNDERGTQPCFVLFDILMINDINLANCQLNERIQHLNQIFTPVRGYLQIVDRKDGNTREDVVTALNDAIDKREEGLIVKQPASLYRPDKRKGSGWLKIKPEYVNSLTDELDVLIVGGYFGVGRRSGMISHFMCAIAVPPQISGEKPSVFHSFCKVGSGYSLLELRELGLKLKPYWNKFDTKNPPNNIILAPGYKERPDVWINPKHSKIVQIKAAEIIVSDRYKCGCTLRFPRLEAFREDKNWYDCMTIDELEEMKQIGSGHLTHRHVDEVGGAPSTKKRRVGTRVERPRGVATQFKQTDVSGIEKVTSIFDGLELCVINGSPLLSKKEIETKIAENGGTFVQNPTQNTYCVLVDKVVVKATNIISKGIVDVVKLKWFNECLTTGTCVQFKPSHMIYTAHETKMRFAELYDKYGDSYMEDIDEVKLMEIFSEITNIPMCPQREIAVMEERYFNDDIPYSIFRQCRLYIDKYEVINEPSTVIKYSPLELIELECRLYGGHVSNVFDESITHVVLHNSDLKRLTDLRKINRKHVKKSHFVLSKWITDSINNRYIKNERLYEP